MHNTSILKKLQQTVMKEYVNTKELYDYKKKDQIQNCWSIWKLCTENFLRL